MQALIYVPKVTPRINYTFRQVCRRILNYNIQFTTKIEEFISYKGVKFSYANQRLGNEVFIQAEGLLSDQGVNDIDIYVTNWKGNPYFFKTSNQSDIPFDIFAASFYLLTRYEEYLPHVKNEKNDFPAKESLAYQNDFLTIPIIDIWMQEFQNILNDKFEGIRTKANTRELNFLLAVEKAFKYRRLGLTRNILGFLKDVSSLNIKEVISRIMTWYDPKRDPYNYYDKLIEYKNKHKVKMMFFFQLGDLSIHTKNISYRKRTYRRLIKSMGDYSEIGLLASQEAIYNFETLKTEIKRFEQIANHELTHVAIHNKGLNFPDYYNNIDKTDIDNDYSMCYPNEVGFRAGTSSSFLFYDLNLEQASPIIIHPVFCNSNSILKLDNDKVNFILKKNKEYPTKYNILIDNSIFENLETRNRVFQLIQSINET